MKIRYPIRTLFKQVALSLCLICFSSHVFAETELIIATGEVPPYVSKKPEQSCLTEILHAVANEMGVKFVFKFMPWKRCEQSVENLKVWAAVPYLVTPEREKKFYFSISLYNRQVKFFYYSPGGKNKNITYSELKDLKDYRIGGVRGYYYKKQFLDAGLELDLVNTEEQNFKKLVGGRVDLIPADETLGWYMIRTLFSPEEIGNFFTIAKPFNRSDIFLMTSKHYPNTQKLLTKFNTALKKIKENSVYQKIADKYGLMLLK